MKSYEHVQHVYVKFVLKLPIVSECTYSIIKLTQDAFKELIVSGIAWDARASEVENDEPKDDLALLVGIERLDQLFDLYYMDIDIVIVESLSYNTSI